MAFQLCSNRNSSAEEEDGVQQVQNDHDDRVEGPVQVKRGWDQVKEREYREDRHEHRVVDRAWVTGEGLGDHVTNESHDKDAEHEL